MQSANTLLKGSYKSVQQGMIVFYLSYRGNLQTQPTFRMELQICATRSERLHLSEERGELQSLNILLEGSYKINVTMNEGI